MFIIYGEVSFSVFKCFLVLFSEKYMKPFQLVRQILIFCLLFQHGNKALTVAPFLAYFSSGKGTKVAFE